jgi:hypothetical protein
MNSKLTATQIVDKNGRTTTVHKRAEMNASSKPQKVPAPAVVKQAATHTATHTLLAKPALLTAAQRKEFRRWYLTFTESNYEELPTEIDPEVQALAWHVTHNGRADHTVVAKILDAHVQSIFIQEYAPAIMRLHSHVISSPITKVEAYLRVAERVGTEDAEAGADPKLPHYITSVMDSYCYRPKEEDRIQTLSIDTEEELASLTAITLFLRNADLSQLHNQYRIGDFADSLGNLVNGRRMINRSLDTYLRENPDEVHAINEYMNNRTPGTTVKDTKQIIQHVAEIKEHGALGQGWL